MRRAFELLSEGTDSVQGHGRIQVLTLSVLPNFALRWLVPRLAEFRHEDHSLDLRVLTSYRSIDFLREDLDAAIRLGTEWPELNSDYLFGSEMFPVCSPGFLAEHPLEMPHDLVGHPLLHVAGVFGVLEDWPLWLAAAQAPEVAIDRGPIFDSYVVAMEAAAHGCGVSMAQSAFVQEDLANGRLVALFSLRVRCNEAWYFLWPKTRISHNVSLFRSWLLANAEKTRDATATATPARPRSTASRAAV